MLSIVATCRNEERRSGASVPNVRHAPLNSSIPAMKFRNSGVIRMVSVLNMVLLHTHYYTHKYP